MIREYVLKQNEIDIRVVEVNLEPLYDFAPQVTACVLLQRLGEMYSELGELVRASDVFINTSPDVGVEVWGSLDKDVAYALAWIIKESKEVGIDKAIEFVRQFTEFDEVKVRELLRKVLRVLILWDGYEHCYALKLRGVFGR
ncbi:MAG: hypothetical protein QXG57_08470 [Thermofilaceae archaeon]